jgi:hypothetical protein
MMDLQYWLWFLVKQQPSRQRKAAVTPAAAFTRPDRVPESPGVELCR